MIHCKNSRYNGGPKPHVLMSEFSTARAFGNFVFCEIGFGTRITALTPTEVACRTSVLGAIDVVEYAGTEAEMRPLVLAAGYYQLIQSTYQTEIIDATVEQLMQLSGGSGLRPFDVVHFGDLIRGHGLVGSVSLLAVGVEPTEKLLAHRSGDVLSAAELHLEFPDISVEELLVV